MLEFVWISSFSSFLHIFKHRLHNVLWLHQIVFDTLFRSQLFAGAILEKLNSTKHHLSLSYIFFLFFIVILWLLKYCLIQWVPPVHWIKLPHLLISLKVLVLIGRRLLNLALQAWLKGPKDRKECLRLCLRVFRVLTNTCVLYHKCSLKMLWELKKGITPLGFCFRVLWMHHCESSRQAGWSSLAFVWSTSVIENWHSQKEHWWMWPVQACVHDPKYIVE